MGSVLRRVALVGVAAGVLVGCVAAFAVAAAKPNKPVITITSGPAEGATVTSGSLSLAFTYNRTPKQTKTLTCVLSGPTSSSAACDAPAALGATGSQSGASYSGLANGSYTFLVSLTLTDGGSTSATRHFRVAGPAIAAGAYHSCALTSTGAVTCWGNNGLGQLGNGTTTDSSTPVAVTGLSSGVTAIAAGSYHSCALTSAGVVKCWGNNVSGELGNGSTIDSSTPVAVTGLSGVTAIAAGGSHSCALTSAGTVTCWGANFVGQLGNGTTTNSSTPVAVTGLSSGVTAIAAGGSDSCALTSAGAATCWGDNVSGQLGNGSTADSSTPVAVTGLANRVTEIATGAYHSCARTSAGAAMCWGDNFFGQLGNGTTTTSSTPVAVTGLSGVTAIAAGAFHSCALTSGGAARCWGDNLDGQLGNGSTTSSSTAAPVTGLTSGATAITAGAFHSCALTSGGAATCWGYNGYGELGDGTTTSSSTPVDVVF